MNSNKQKGQALVTLLFFVIIGVTITTAAVIVILTSTEAASRYEQGTDAYYVAESGMENALLQLLRNPGYTGEMLTIGSGTASVSATPGNPITIISVGQQGNYIRKIQVQAVYNNNKMTFSSWKEIN